MGRLTLNILLSFAQFEREVIGERIRDKFAASRRKGMWMGGWAPLGYDIKDRKLIINEREAELVRSIFTRFARGIPPQQLIEALADGRRPQQARQAHRQGLPLSGPAQPGLPRRGRAQGHGAPRRTRSDH